MGCILAHLAGDTLNRCTVGLSPLCLDVPPRNTSFSSHYDEKLNLGGLPYDTSVITFLTASGNLSKRRWAASVIRASDMCRCWPHSQQTTWGGGGGGEGDLSAHTRARKCKQCTCLLEESIVELVNGTIGLYPFSSLCIINTLSLSH